MGLIESIRDDGYAYRLYDEAVSLLHELKKIVLEFNDNFLWRCGCCNPNFQVTPNTQDYLYYINAVEM